MIRLSFERALALAAVAAAVLVPGAALACGGFYASDIEVAPSQSIVVVHRDGVETYVFRPRFCGAAKDFGVILPIPAPLSASPTLADAALFDELTAVAAPEVVEVCKAKNAFVSGCGSSDEGVGSKGPEAMDGGFGRDVTVVDRGRVGQFEYVLLQATTTTAFTDWLDQNGFPRGTASTDAYQAYVDKAWYFVAFKVSADTAAPPAGTKLCGDLGPIQLSFPASYPVVPARIASVNQSASVTPVWRLFLVATMQQRLAGTGSLNTGAFHEDRYFSGTVGQTDLVGRPAVSTLAREGERLTVLDVSFTFGVSTGDIVLIDDPVQQDFRTKIYVEKDCDSGSCTAGGSAATGAFGVFAVFVAMSALRRRIW